jgi:hypothetical protein
VNIDTVLTWIIALLAGEVFVILVGGPLGSVSRVEGKLTWAALQKALKVSLRRRWAKREMRAYEHQQLLRLRKFFFFDGLSAEFFIIYRQNSLYWAPGLKWCEASARSDGPSWIESEASRFCQLATWAFVARKNWCHEVVHWNPGCKGRNWNGLFFPDQASAIRGKPNALGQRWWMLVSGPGPIREAGYAVVAMVAAKDVGEITSYIDRMNSVWAA